MDVLKSKHPNLWDPEVVGEQGGAFEPYNKVLTVVPAVISLDVVEDAASSKLSRSDGPSKTNSVELQNWLLRYK